MGSMKVHLLPRGFWKHEPTSLSLGCKRLRPLAPKLANPTNTSSTTTTTTTTTTTSNGNTNKNNNNNVTSFDLKSFIRPESGPRKLLGSSSDEKKDSTQPHPQVETHPGGTRWNPTPEQIGILEMLYKGGMRTPNAQQIEQITAQLVRYGKIEGKNVFYWFQNHKARERQKQKRNSLGLAPSPRTAPTAPVTTISLDIRREVRRDEDSAYKRKCMVWSFEHLELEGSKLISRDDHRDNRTLELFPLHPEGR